MTRRIIKKGHRSQETELCKQIKQYCDIRPTDNICKQLKNCNAIEVEQTYLKIPISERIIYYGQQCKKANYKGNNCNQVEILCRSKKNAETCKSEEILNVIDTMKEKFLIDVATKCKFKQDRNCDTLINNCLLYSSICKENKTIQTVYKSLTQ